MLSNPPADPQTPPAGDPPVAPPVPPQGDPAGTGTPPTTEDTDPNDVDGYKKALAASRAEAEQAKRDAKAATKQLEAAQAEVKKHADAEKTELERAVSRAEEAEKARLDLETRHRSAVVKHAVSTAARDAGFANPDVAYRMLDLDKIEFDDDGEPQGVDAAVKALATAEPWMIGTKDGSKQGPPSTPKSDRNGNGVTPEEDSQHRDSFAANMRRRF